MNLASSRTEWRTSAGTSRQRFLATGGVSAAAFAVLSGRAGAAEFTFKCASTFPVDHPSSVRMRQMWSAVEHDSGGRIRTQFFPDGVLGGDAAMIPQLKVGGVQFFLAAIGSVTAIAPLANMFFLGFAYKNNKEGLGIVDGPLGDMARSQVTAQGIHPCKTVWASGMVELTSSLRPVRGPDDLKGFKVRVSLGKTAVDLFKDLGATPTPINNNEIYTALQTRLIDGTASPLQIIETGRLFETQKYISLTNHQCGSFWLLANTDAWKSLPPDLQGIVERNNTKYAMLDRRDTDVMDDSLRDKLTRQGITINEVDQAPFRARLTNYYRSWADEFGPGPWNMLQKALDRKLA